MKKLFYFAAVLAIAMFAALNLGMSWLFCGIMFFFLLEYCYFASYDVELGIGDYEKNKKDSRNMIVVHMAWFICTIILAAILGVLDGYDFTTEVPVGNNFKYERVHQEGFWWLLSIMILLRVVEQRFIEDQINKNIKLFKDRNYPKAV